MPQLDLFTQPVFSVHASENNHVSRVILEENRKRFEGQCRKVFEALMNGNSLTTTSALVMGIGDLRRRMKDLKDIHKVQFEWRLDEGRYKTWFMTEENKKYNQKFIINNNN